MSNKFVCIIPARYKSSRFEGKPLALIHESPMIVWVIKHAKKASKVLSAVVATDDENIYRTVTQDGYQAKLTSPDCDSGSARVAEVAKDMEDDWIFEMQGDQPLVTPDIIDDFLERAEKLILENPNIDVVIPYAPALEEHILSPDVLKVVKTGSDRLVFQTRHPIKTGWRTLGLYLWKNKALQRFTSLPVSDIEKAEDSHPIRLYINDFYVQGLLIDTSNWVEVDREYQIKEVERIMNERGISKTLPV